MKLVHSAVHCCIKDSTQPKCLTSIPDLRTCTALDFPIPKNCKVVLQLGEELQVGEGDDEVCCLLRRAAGDHYGVLQRDGAQSADAG